MRRVTLLLVVAVLSLAIDARAQEREALAVPPAISPITLSVPAECPDRAALEGEIAALLGRPFDQIPIPETSFTALVITREGERYVLVVTTEAGERTLRDPSCAALVRAAALIVALQIDADAATLAAASAAEASQIAEDAARAEQAAQPLPPPPTRSRRSRFILDHAARLGDPSPPFRLRAFAIGAGIGLESGLVPSVAASLFADVVVRIDRLELRGRFTYVVEQGQLGVVGVRASAVSGTLLGCGRPFDATFALAICGGIEGGDLFARSVGVSNPAVSDGGFFSAVLGLWLPLFPWTGIDVSLGAEGWAHLTRPIFEVEGVGTTGIVYAPDPYGGRFAIAIHWNP
jgi:hypothetical protein